MTSMNISTLWEKSTLWALKRYGVYSEDIQIENTIMKALCLRQAEHNAPNGISPAVKHMVCVHGLGSSGAAYGQLLPYLAKYWPEVWAPSAPGHGMSPPFPKSTTQTTEQSESSSYQRFQNMKERDVMKSMMIRKRGLRLIRVKWDIPDDQLESYLLSEINKIM